MTDFFNCEQCVDLLLDYLEGALDEETQTRLDEHLAACPPCVNFMQTYRQSAELTAGLKDRRVDVPAEVQERIKSFLHQEIVGLGKVEE